MQTARCLEDGAVHSAIEFARLHPDMLSRVRRLLRCPECDGQAFFRKSSRNNGMPCFGARPHANGCSLAVQDNIRPDDEITDDQHDWLGLANRIVVDFDFGSHYQYESASVSNQELEQSRIDGVGGIGGQSAVFAHRRLSSLLRMLIKAPGFGRSDQLLNIFGQEIAAKNIFVPILEAAERHHGRCMLFWGMLTDARCKNTLYGRELWLNGGDVDNLSFCVKASDVDYVLNRYRISRLDDLAGAYVLIFGAFNYSQLGKRYCIIDSPDYMALRLT